MKSRTASRDDRERRYLRPDVFQTVWKARLTSILWHPQRPRNVSLQVPYTDVFLTVQWRGLLRSRRVSTRCCACTGYRQARLWILFPRPGDGLTNSQAPGGVSGARSDCRARYTGELVPVSAASYCPTSQSSPEGRGGVLPTAQPGRSKSRTAAPQTVKDGVRSNFPLF